MNAAEKRRFLFIAAAGFLAYALSGKGKGAIHRVVIPPDEPLLNDWRPMNGRLVLT